MRVGSIWMSVALGACAPLDVVQDKLIETDFDVDSDRPGNTDESDETDPSGPDTAKVDTAASVDTDDVGGTVSSGGTTGNGEETDDTWTFDSGFDDTWTFDSSWQDTWTWDSSWQDTWTWDSSWQDTWTWDSSWQDTSTWDSSWQDTSTWDTSWGDTWWSDSSDSAWDTSLLDTSFFFARRAPTAGDQASCTDRSMPPVPSALLQPRSLGTLTGSALACEAGVAAYVNGDASYPTVSEAVLAAPAGAVVDVCPGTHPLSARVKVDGLTLRSVSGQARNTVLTGEGRRRILTVGAGLDLDVVGLTLLDGYSPREGGALRAKDAGRIVLEDVRLIGNRAGERGGAISVAGALESVDAALELVNVDGIGNSAVLDGGAIAVGGSASGPVELTLSGSRMVSNCTDGRGGAISALGAVTVNVYGGGLWSNHADAIGGGMHLGLDEGAAVGLYDLELRLNQAADGADVLAQSFALDGESGRVIVEGAQAASPTVMADLGVILERRP